MGKSAKVHKRIKLKSSSSSTISGTLSSSRMEAAQSAKKRSKLKDKVSSAHTSAVGLASDSGPGKRSRVLGGADYVSLLMGGRRKAKEEALKLLQT